MIPWAREAGFHVETAEGRLIGSFNPVLPRPDVAASRLDLEDAEKAHTTLSERVRQGVTLAVGAVCDASYEFCARSAAAARMAGPSEAAIRTLWDGAA